MSMSNRRWDSWMPDSDVTPMYRKIPKSTASGIRRSTAPMTMDRPGGGDTHLRDPSGSPREDGRAWWGGDEPGLITVTKRRCNRTESQERAQVKRHMECQEAGLGVRAGASHDAFGNSEGIWVKPGMEKGFKVQERKSGGWGPGPCKVGALTHEAGDEHSSDPLLPHLLDLGLLTGSNGSAHNGQRVHVSDRADGGGREPGQPKQATEPTQGADEKQVQVEAGAFEQPPRLLADNEPAGRGWEAGVSRGWGGGQRQGQAHTAGTV